LLADDEVSELINDSIKRFPLNWSRALREDRRFAELQRELITDIVWKTLRTPLGALGKRLCDIPKEHRIHELEFFASKKQAALPRTIEEVVESGNDLLTGFIDLVFRVDEKFYLLDWKSNAAAPYDESALQQCMQEHDYHRQYQLYSHVLLRWLGQTVKDFNPNKHFGGVLYLFLRGFNGTDDKSGVFFTRADGRF
jgi:exodeoxyribonuclease V beta subunit